MTSHLFSSNSRSLQWGLFLLLCLVAALLPLAPLRVVPSGSPTAFPGWPAEFEGNPLRQLELSAREAGFSKNFAGQIARFTDGEREFILRWFDRPSPSLRSAWDALHGSGYQLHFGPIWRDAQGYPWRTFDAVAENEKWHVLERIYDDEEQSWTDVSSWYWAVVLRKTNGPWWVVSVLEERNTTHK